MAYNRYVGRAIIFVLLGMLLSGFGLILLRGSEDSWICREGTWVKHGNPNAPKPIVPCPKKKTGMKFTSVAFADNTELPVKYSCQGAGMSPPFTIGDVIPLAQSLAIVLDDPDAPAGTFHHWIVWNIDPKTTEIKENTLPIDAVMGSNSTGQTGFVPPCPPSGTHRYIFTLYALDNPLTLAPGAQRSEFDRAISGHVLMQATLTGRSTKQ